MGESVDAFALRLDVNGISKHRQRSSSIWIQALHAARKLNLLLLILGNSFWHSGHMLSQPYRLRYGRLLLPRLDLLPRGLESLPPPLRLFHGVERLMHASFAAQATAHEEARGTRR
eukprot:2628068-Pleurochrysis_carterae.AAC.3